MQAKVEAARDPVAIVAENPTAIFTGEVAFSDFYAELRERLMKVGADTSSDKRRKEIASAARKAASAKTAIDGAGKDLNAAKRKEIDEVDRVRRTVRDQLDALRDEIRRPLDQWEEQEEARKASHLAVIERIASLAYVNPGTPSAEIAKVVAEVEGMNVSEAELQEFAEHAAGKREATLGYLRQAHATAVQAEKDAAELAELRRKQAEQKAKEAAERAERERQEREAEEARRKAEAEEARKREIAEAEKRAAEKAQREAEARLREAEERAAREKAEAEARAEAERQRIIREQEEREAARLAEEERKRQEEERRAADAAHRGRIIGEIEAALEGHAGVDCIVAAAVAEALAAGVIPHVTVRF